MTDQNSPDGPTPAERRLATLLAEVEADPPVPHPALAERVMRTARWQYAARGLFVSVSEVAAAVGAGLDFLLSERERRR